MINNDLISRSKLLAAYDAAHKGPPGGARKLIVEAPAVDAEPIRHGKWVNKGVDFAHSEVDEWMYEWKCSACNAGSIVNGEYPRSKFCMNCGAKMDGSDGDGAGG